MCAAFRRQRSTSIINSCSKSTRYSPPTWRRRRRPAAYALDDPFLTARVFMGMTASYFLIQEVIGARFHTPVRPEAWTHEVVERFVNGILPNGILPNGTLSL